MLGIYHLLCGGRRRLHAAPFFCLTLPCGFHFWASTTWPPVVLPWAVPIVPRRNHCSPSRQQFLHRMSSWVIFSIAEFRVLSHLSPGYLLARWLVCLPTMPHRFTHSFRDGWSDVCSRLHSLVSSGVRFRSWSARSWLFDGGLYGLPRRLGVLCLWIPFLQRLPFKVVLPVPRRFCVHQLPSGHPHPCWASGSLHVLCGVRSGAL
mmetsp:Transcript_16515/g.44918  ORF Transcript_16515/g.44918 Transcript_16515/m.44918 type:complete len:205 (+) Transcript_16515:4903-5517(+)